MNKLQELHKEIIEFKTYADIDMFGNSCVKGINKASKGSSELTKTIAIEFSLWQQRGECRWVLNDEDEWMYDTDYSKRINTEELFNLFIEEKYGK